MMIRRSAENIVKRYGSVSVLLGALLVAFYLVSRLPNETMLEREKFFMGTVIQIKISVDVNGDLQDAHDAMVQAFQEVERVEKVFSVFQPQSEIYKINRLKKGEACKTTREVFDLIEKSAAYTARTSGAFDITVGPLVKLWGAAAKKDVLPSDAELAMARERVGGIICEGRHVSRSGRCRKGLCR